MKKTELALLYMPYASADVARRHLNKCIRRNRELLEALEATGWAFWIHWLTPLQVELIENALVAGLTASGADAYMLYVTTTPSVAYVVRTKSFSRIRSAFLESSMTEECILP